MDPLPNLFERELTESIVTLADDVVSAAEAGVRKVHLQRDVRHL